ncbi:vimentin-type intermediate filament-associated coiled-coil protein [Pyxicephalus adspersus]|uniref:Uncharacterized protein n=1 Tax=Pyxicephalus adspersus TaxID=30357 RepID=A0AAV3B0F0_PYXAD|nr:TPA: hypothetical protein GDO54_008933 [Pyxicephalus adspersus]
MSSINTTQIKEANAHLALLHQRVSDLEGIIKEQAENLIRKDEHCQRVINRVVEEKDGQLAELQKRLAYSEEVIERLYAANMEKDRELVRMRHHGRLLAQICQRRSQLETLTSLMAEAEAVLSLSGLGVGVSSFPSNFGDYSQTEEDPEGSDSERISFGTNV